MRDNVAAKEGIGKGLEDGLDEGNLFLILSLIFFLSLNLVLAKREIRSLAGSRIFKCPFGVSVRTALRIMPLRG